MSDEHISAFHRRMIKASRMRYFGAKKTAEIEAEEARMLPPGIPIEEPDLLIEKVRAAKARRTGMHPDAPQHEVEFANRMIDAAELKYGKPGRGRPDEE